MSPPIPIFPKERKTKPFAFKAKPETNTLCLVERGVISLIAEAR